MGLCICDDDGEDANKGGNYDYLLDIMLKKRKCVKRKCMKMKVGLR